LVQAIPPFLKSYGARKYFSYSLRAKSVSPKGGAYEGGSVLYGFAEALSKKERSRRTGQTLATYFLGQGDDFSWRKGQKISGCASNLEHKQDQAEPYSAHRYCHDRFCPSCGWWKSEQLKERFESVRSAIEEDYPGFRWVYVTLTLVPCLTEMLEGEIRQVSQGIPRLLERMKRRGLEVLGYYRFTELDKFSKEESRVTSVRSICCLPTVRPALTVVSGDSGVSTI
jgi:hypothetical protein